MLRSPQQERGRSWALTPRYETGIDSKRYIHVYMYRNRCVYGYVYKCPCFVRIWYSWHRNGFRVDREIISLDEEMGVSPSVMVRNDEFYYSKDSLQPITRWVFRKYIYEPNASALFLRVLHAPISAWINVVADEMQIKLVKCCVAVSIFRRLTVSRPFSFVCIWYFTDMWLHAAALAVPSYVLIQVLYTVRAYTARAHKKTWLYAKSKNEQKMNKKWTKNRLSISK